MTKQFHATITSIKPLTDKILHIQLELNTPAQYAAGQYLEIITADGQHMPFSIANAPLGTKQIELHIRHTPDNKYSSKLLAEIKQCGAISFAAPFGTCTYKSLKPQFPVIFMAGGSGFAPIKAIIEQMFTEGDNLPMHLYWGAKSASDLYLDELPQSWAKHVQHFSYTPVLSHPLPEWQGRKGLVYQAILADFSDLSRHQILAAGPFDMIFKAREEFLNRGLLPDNMYSDAFSFI